MKVIIGEKNEKYVENRSKFFSYIFFCDNLEKQEQIIRKIKSNHPSATHVCFASIIDEGEIKTYSNDDREPSNTAGGQILLALKKNDMVNTLCVVVRYFGGVKLGTVNLSKAYKTSAEMAIEENTKEVVKKTKYDCECSYENYDKIKKILAKNNLQVCAETFCESVKFSVYLTDNEEHILDEKCDKTRKNDYKYM